MVDAGKYTPNKVTVTLQQYDPQSPDGGGQGGITASGTGKTIEKASRNAQNNYRNLIRARIHQQEGKHQASGWELTELHKTEAEITDVIGAEEVA